MTKTPTRRNTTLKLKQNLFLLAAALQVGCCVVFAADVAVELGEFTIHESFELAGVIALAVGSFISIDQYRKLLRRNTKVERELDAASGAFQAVIEQHFDDWQLTDAERDVALLSIKGVPISEIAVMRQTQTGTIKAQNAAIYRKSGVSSRTELVTVMIEEMILGLDLTQVSASAERNRDPA